MRSNWSMASRPLRARATTVSSGHASVSWRSSDSRSSGSSSAIRAVGAGCIRLASIIPGTKDASLMQPAPTALIAEDEPLLRESLERQLTEAWPELTVVARARNGREAIDQFDRMHPSVCFLDVHMPGVTGIEAARHIGHRAHLVFVTAFDQYAVQAFAQGVIDYLVKPVDAARLAQTVARLQERLRDATAAVNTDALLLKLAAALERREAPAPLRWIRASVGQTVTLIPVEQIDFLRAEEKYKIGRVHV